MTLLTPPTAVSGQGVTRRNVPGESRLEALSGERASAILAVNNSLYFTALHYHEACIRTAPSAYSEAVFSVVILQNTCEIVLKCL